MDTQAWKQYIPAFREKSAQFYDGTVSRGEYKSFSGFYGSYAQKDGKANMLRLRMTAGRVTKERMEFVVNMLKKYSISRMHFTTCQTIQLHDLEYDDAADIMEAALDAGIVTLGGGGDYPRNVMCPPLSGVEKGEYFDVTAYAEAAGEYLLQFITAKKMPRKLKVCFSSSPQNETHATYRDLGFAADAEGKFDVYSAGGLGANPRLGVNVAEKVEPDMILYYIKAMWMTFVQYGNYENRAKARTRYMQETLGGAEQYAKAYQENLKAVLDSGEDLKLHVTPKPITKQGDGTKISGQRIIEQKQEGLYAVEWHPAGGQPQADEFCALYETIRDMDDVELRLSPDETAYIINLTGQEAKKVLEAAKSSAASDFEKSISCIGAAVCQTGARDSQALLYACVEAVRKAEIAKNALPKIHISGCPSSCGAHQTNVIGFRGGVKKIDGSPKPAFVLYTNGCSLQGQESMGKEIGAILETQIPEFIVKLGRAVMESGMDFTAWNEKNPDGIEKIAEEYTA